MPRQRIRFGDGRVYRLRVELADVTPAVWRRLEVSGRASLRELHEAVECAFIRAAHAYEFEVDGVRYVDAADDPPPGRSADNASLDSLRLHIGSRFTHDVEGPATPWRYVITVEEIGPRLVGQRVPLCIAARGGAPPEHVESVADFTEFLAAWRDPDHPRSAEVRQWHPDAFDPDYTDLAAINAALARVPKHRPPT